MPVAGRFPEIAPRPPPRACPACGCDLWGARLCEVCGAGDFAGEGLWVCFSCGEGNGPRQEKCGRCSKNHVIACPACGAEGFHRQLFCESCGAARALYPRIRQLLAEAARPRPHRPRHGSALVVVVLLAFLAMALAAALVGTTRRSAAAASAGVAVAAGIVAGALARRARRDPRMLS